MPSSKRLIIGGVDTHAATHHAAVIDLNGRLLADAQFPASPRGYALMLKWMQGKGRLDRVGIEGTGAYGAGLARHLHNHGVRVLEVPRPDRRLRRQHGKSDPLDAEAAARAVLAGNACSAPKLATGPIEAIRMLRIARTGAVKAKTAAINTLLGLIVTAPEPLRSQLRRPFRDPAHRCLRSATTRHRQPHRSSPGSSRQHCARSRPELGPWNWKRVA